MGRGLRRAVPERGRHLAVPAQRPAPVPPDAPAARASREVRPHTLRHTYASLLFEAGVELAVVQELLGHADLATTRDIYVHLSDRVKRKAGDLLQARLVSDGPHR